MKLTHEPGVELGAGFYWGVARSVGWLTKKVTDIGPAVVRIEGQRPFLSHEVNSRVPLPDEVHLIERIEEPARLAELVRA